MVWNVKPITLETLESPNSPKEAESSVVPVEEQQTDEIAQNLAAVSINPTPADDVWWNRVVRPDLPAEDPNSDRTQGLGNFAVLGDGLIQYMLVWHTDPAELCALNATSKAWYVETIDHEVWRKVAMRVWNFKSGRFPWKGRWKETSLTMLHIAKYEDRMTKEGKSYEEIESSEELQRIINRIPRFESKFEIFSFDSKSPAFVSGFNGMLMHRRWYKANFPIDNLDIGYSHLERISAKTVTVEQFKETYEKGSRPVLITDLMEDWPAMEKWTEKCLLERFGNTVFKMTHKQAGARLRMKIADFFSYWKDNKDHDPLYLFESNFVRKAPPMGDEFKVPKYFEEDLLGYLEKRPFERWAIMGPARTGTSFHTDPLSSSAWNALISGRKRWALYPPNWPIAPGSLSMHPDDKFDAEVEPSSWILEHYPFLAPEFKPWECVQRAGEVIFVPAGWWHMVLNLDCTIAVTQNFVDEHNLEMVWDDITIMADGEPDEDDDVILKRNLREKLREHRPDLYKRIEEWSKEDEEEESAKTPRVPPLRLDSVPDGPQNWVEQPMEQIYPSSNSHREMTQS